MDLLNLLPTSRRCSLCLWNVRLRGIQRTLDNQYKLLINNNLCYDRRGQLPKRKVNIERGINWKNNIDLATKANGTHCLIVRYVTVSMCINGRATFYIKSENHNSDKNIIPIYTWHTLK